jgi:hypothetical protein
MLKASGPHRQALKRYRRDEGVADKGAKVTKILAMILDLVPRYEVEEVFERPPYDEDVGARTRRAYVFARKPV